MKVWHDKGDLVERLAQARRDARDTVPRSGGNDALEAAMFFAMMHELDRWAGEQDQQSAPEPEAEVATLQNVQVLPPPEVVTEPPPEDQTLLPEVNYADAG